MSESPVMVGMTEFPGCVVCVETDSRDPRMVRVLFPGPVERGWVTLPRSVLSEDLEARLFGVGEAA